MNFRALNAVTVKDVAPASAEPKKEFNRFLKPAPAEDFKRLYSLESPTELIRKRVMQQPGGLRQKMTSEDTGVN